MFLWTRTVTQRLLAALLLALLPVPAMAEAQGEEITALCTVSTPGFRSEWRKALDRNYRSFFARYDDREITVEIGLPRRTEAGGLYLCFFTEPMEIKVYGGQESEPFYTARSPVLPHLYIPFEGQSSLRLALRGERGIGFGLSEFFVTRGKTPPDFVQRWEPPLERADLLVLVAHPDDELLWMGGALPYYALERGKDVAVAYMTCSNPLRRSELLNGLWTAGIRHYPYIGPFRDKRKQHMSENYRVWGGREKVESHIVSLYRRLKPQVVLSHDLKGEYGHPAHIITARAAVAALEPAADAEAFRDSAEAFGTWEVPKLYLHLYQENPIVMDWETELDSLGGQTAVERTREAFSMHRSQRAKFSVELEGPYSAARFGLVRSLVGEDSLKDDFFENIP